MLGIVGVMLRDTDAGVEGVGEVGGFLAALDGTPGFPGTIHWASSTCSPARQRANSASKDAMYFWYDVLANCAFCRRPLSSSGDNSALTRAEFLIDLARIPKRRVDSVSASLYDEGEQLMMRVVREFPPNDSCKIRVSFESRYGMCLACIETCQRMDQCNRENCYLAVCKGVDDHAEG